MAHDEMTENTGAVSPETEPAAEAPPPPPPEAPEPAPAAGGRGLGGQVAAGLTLLALGAALLYLERFDGGSNFPLFLILIGGLFLAAYFHQRAYGFLIPGGILLGIGSGFAFEELSSSPFADGDLVTLGLGLGFLFIYAVSLLYERQNRWWSLIPGGFLVVAGFPEWEWVEELYEFWPLAVMAGGAVLLLRAVQARRREAEARRFNP